MDRNKQAIGVFDSGVGGLTVASKLHTLLPHENIIYVGDTKRNPYGPRSKAEIMKFASEILTFLDHQDIKLAASGCNTMTALAADVLDSHEAYPVIGMSRGLHTASDTSTNKKIAVFATQATIDSHSHKKMAEKIAPDITIIEKACPALAGLVEQGVLQGEEILAPLHEYVQPVIEAGADTAIFGCTHYPFVQNLFEELCPHIVFVDPAHEMALDVLDALKENGTLNMADEPGHLRLCFTAEAERGRKLAKHILPENEFTVEEISLF